MSSSDGQDYWEGKVQGGGTSERAFYHVVLKRSYISLTPVRHYLIFIFIISVPNTNV